MTVFPVGTGDVLAAECSCVIPTGVQHRVQGKLRTAGITPRKSVGIRAAVRMSSDPGDPMVDAGTVTEVHGWDSVGSGGATSGINKTIASFDRVRVHSTKQRLPRTRV